MIKRLIIDSVIVVLALLVILIGQYIPMSNQAELYEGLRNTSAIIFGVMGAWVAILHPDKIRSILSGNTHVSEEEEDLIKKLLHPIVISTFIISVVLIVQLLSVVIASFSVLQDYRPYFRGISFCLLFTLTFAQIWTVIATLVPIDIVNFKIGEQKKAQEIKRKMFSRAKESKSSSNEE